MQWQKQCEKLEPVKGKLIRGNGRATDGRIMKDPTQPMNIIAAQGIMVIWQESLQASVEVSSHDTVRRSSFFLSNTRDGSRELGCDQEAHV